MTSTQALNPAIDTAADPTDSSSEPVVKCAGLTKIFRDFWLRPRARAVDHIDLEIRRGEVFGLLGPNGSGKSTTIKMILGLLYPTSGRIAVFGKRPEDVATKNRIGYLPEESYLYRFLNARETLDYYGRLFHQDATQRRRRIDKLLEMVGLDAAQNRPVGEYSKGMQRRIGLAQALINDPDLLILDEPTTGMDPIGTRQIKDLILELARPRNGKPGKTVLLCSHQLDDVEDVCHRIAIMFGGKVRALGTCDELLIRREMHTIQTQTLDVQTIQAIEAVLEARGKHIERVDQPRQNLESLFLQIVTQAHAEGLATSGAKSGGKIADFLVQGANQSEPANAEEVIERLMAPQAQPAAVSAPVVPTPAAQAVKAERDAGQQVLRDLTQPKPSAPAPKPQAAPASGGGAAASTPVESPDTEFLRSLMDNPSGDTPSNKPAGPDGPPTRRN